MSIITRKKCDLNLGPTNTVKKTYSTKCLHSHYCTTSWNYMCCKSLTKRLNATINGQYMEWENTGGVWIKVQHSFVNNPITTIDEAMMCMWSYSLMLIEVGISVQSRAYFTGVTSSWGSRSTWACSISLQKDARRSYGRVSSIMQRKMSSTSRYFEISSIARYWRSEHIWAYSFSWYLEKKDILYKAWTLFLK